MSRTFASLALLLLVTVGCKVQTDLGTPCRMWKRAPDGGRDPLLEGQIKAGRDFIAFGSVDCEDLVCVRDKNYVPDGGMADQAKGYCSKPCVQSESACPPADDADLKVPSRKLYCRPLLLDSETLSLICDNPDGGAAKCLEAFGNTSSPDFCVRGSPDAG